MLELENISKTFNAGEKITPIEDISFKLDPASITSIVGESGTGKSTLLMIMGGLLQPSQGKLLLDDKDFWQLSDEEQANIRSSVFGYLFQSSVMVKALTVSENIAFASKLSGNDIEEKEIMNILEDLGIKDKANSLPHTLSGGQRRRAMMAITYARNPRIIIADEPTNDLDGVWKSRVLDIFQEWRANGKSIIIASHDPEVAKLGDKKYKIENKKLVAI